MSTNGQSKADLIAAAVAQTRRADEEVVILRRIADAYRDLYDREVLRREYLQARVEDLETRLRATGVQQTPRGWQDLAATVDPISVLDRAG